MTPEERLTELEIRYTHQQEVIDQLSDLVAWQGRQLDALRAELDRLRRYAEADEPSPHERPPHY
ncbi:MAG: SlyX family protein [Myxococcales bacterium]|nr:SlyX family protein [Polyangiaceae bacterium]MDW8251735.1 SlyX family protein [Myxococcales bacterium]